MAEVLALGSLQGGEWVRRGVEGTLGNPHRTSADNEPVVMPLGGYN